MWVGQIINYAIKTKKMVDGFDANWRSYQMIRASSRGSYHQVILQDYQCPGQLRRQFPGTKAYAAASDDGKFSPWISSEAGFCAEVASVFGNRGCDANAFGNQGCDAIAHLWILC